MLASLLTFLQANKMPDIVFREITGNNIPHVAIVRNKDEFLDQSMSQFGNTAAYFGTGLLMDKALNAVPKLARLQLNQATKHWFFLGKSLSIFSLIAAVNLATPFLRNYITTKRTGTTNYAEMIGEKVRNGIDKQTLDAKMKEDKNRFFKTVGIGLAISASIMAATLVFNDPKTPNAQASPTSTPFCRLER